MPNCRPYRGFQPPDVTPAVFVSLTGAFGRGRTMILDPDTWESLKATQGDQWTQNRDSAGRWFVGSMSRSDVRVARKVVGAIPPRYVIRYRNGDHLDCRRANLIVLPPKPPAPNPSVLTSQSHQTHTRGIHA